MAMNSRIRALGQAVSAAAVAALLLGGMPVQGVDATPSTPIRTNKSLPSCEKGTDEPHDCRVSTAYVAVAGFADTP
jgi:hypothetical protein